MDPQELQHKKELVEIHKERKRFLEKQAAAYGLSVDPRIPIELKNLTQQISDLDEEIVSAEGLHRPSAVRATERPLANSSDASARRTTARPAVNYSKPASPAAPSSYRLSHPALRRLGFLLLAVALVLLLLGLLPKGTTSAWIPGLFPPANPTLASIAKDAPTQKPRVTLSVGQAWEKNGMILSLAKISAIADVVQVKWIFTNNTENDIVLPARTYSVVGASSTDGVQPILSNICSEIDGDFNCNNKDRVIKKGQQITIFNTLRYPTLDFSNLKRTLIIVSGITNEAQWSIST